MARYKIATAFLASMVLLLLAACADGHEEGIPPCTPIEGSERDPCEGHWRDDGINLDTMLLNMTYLGEQPISIQEALLRESINASHIVVRATSKPGSLRCEPRREFRGQGWTTLGDPKVTTGIGTMHCYLDYRVNAYIVGTGPSTLTAVVLRQHWWEQSLSDEKIDAERIGIENALLGTGTHWRIENVPTGGIEGYEEILFLGPAMDASLETWQIYEHWDVERRDDETVYAKHPDHWFWTNHFPVHASKLELTLAEFVRQAQAASTKRANDFSGRTGLETHYPSVITNANNLNAWHVTVGNTTHPNGAPEAPPPPRTPTPAAPMVTASEASVTASWPIVAGIAKHRLEYKSAGEETWTVANDAITTNSQTLSLSCGGTYTFRLSAYGDGTTYHDAWSHPAADVRATTTACVTPVFGEASYAFSVVDGSAVGTAVGAVSATDPNNDAVTYSISAGNTGTAFAISSTGAITTAGAINHATTSSYSLTVAASDGTNSASVPVTVTVTIPNAAPVFGGPYSFSVAENARGFTVVGTVAATDADGDTPTYHITAGNSAGKFSIDLNAGFILVRGSLDYETTSSYTLTVEARDGKGGVGTASVTITVTDVAE